MRAFVSRVARTLNRLWSRRGAVFPRRFHDVVLRSLLQVRNALRYVLNNHLKHGARTGRGGCLQPDAYSSGDEFDGWAEIEPTSAPGSAGSTVAAGGWKLSCGWRKRYPWIGVAEVPRAVAN
jgi:hypothetical protein